MGKADEIKGRAKEAIGAVTDDSAMKKGGKADRAAGKVKDAVDGVRKKITPKDE
jgi:uncharacterized protein YjbJ (UPF0337 family)